MLEDEDLNSIVILPAVCPLSISSTFVILVFLTVKWGNTHLCLMNYYIKTLSAVPGMVVFTV